MSAQSILQEPSIFSVSLKGNLPFYMAGLLASRSAKSERGRALRIRGALASSILCGSRMQLARERPLSSKFPRFYEPAREMATHWSSYYGQSLSSLVTTCIVTLSMPVDMASRSFENVLC